MKLFRITSAFATAAIIAAAAVFSDEMEGCGSAIEIPNSVPPTVTTLRDRTGADVLPGTTTASVDPTTFTITFSEAMKPASVTTAGNLTFTCTGLPSGLDQPTIIVTEISSSVYDVDIVDAYKYQLQSCVLGLTTSIKNSSGVAMAAASFNLTTACAVSDAFYVNSQSCWTVYPTGMTWTTWDELTSAGVFAYLAPASTGLEINDSACGVTTERVAEIIKTIDVGDSFTIEAHMSEIAGLVDLSGGVTDSIRVGVVSASDLSKGYSFGVEAYLGGITICQAASPDGNLDTPCPETDLYLKLDHGQASVTAQYSVDGTTWLNIGSGTLPRLDMSGEAYLFIFFRGETTNLNNRAIIKSIVTTGLTSTTQYSQSADASEPE